MKTIATVLLCTVIARAELTYPIVGTGQAGCYDDRRQIDPPKPGEAFYGQDAQFPGPKPAYKDNGDGTVSDLVTGLMWIKARGPKVPFADALAGAAACKVGGHTDWRMPTIKELYSLINFNGGFHPEGGSVPYLDKVFEFAYGDESRGERGIDCQDWSATQYLSTTMNGNATVFGVNFADGRIKGYPRDRARAGVNRLYVRYVRGNPSYGRNDFQDNKDGTITDRATGLMWTQSDSGKGVNWQQALAYAQEKNKEKFLGHGDWRLPNAKELQSLVDYARCPEAPRAEQRGPAIDPMFEVTKLKDGDYPWYWSGTTHLDGPRDRMGSAAVYVCFGRSTGWMSFPPGRGELKLLDVHGAGAQRSDPKRGDAADYPRGRGPQGDVVRIDNFVRLVRNR